MSEYYANSWLQFYAYSSSLRIDWYYVELSTGITWIVKSQTHTAGPGSWCWQNWQNLLYTAMQGRPGDWQVEVWFGGNGGYRSGTHQGTFYFSIFPKIGSGGTYGTSPGDGKTVYNPTDGQVRVFTNWYTTGNSYGHTINYRWYRPDGSLHHTGPGLFLPQGHNPYHMTDALDISATNADQYPGIWTVRPWINLNNFFQAAQYQFTLNPPAPPGAPSSLTATTGPGAGQITLNWNEASGYKITNHKIYRGTSSGGDTYLTTVGKVLSFTDSGLAAGTTYHYRVSAVNVAGEGPKSNGASAPAPTPPGTPQNLLASTGPGGGQITLTWQPPSSSGGLPLTNFRIYRGINSGELFYLTQVGTGISYTDSGLNPGTYYYQVSAVNAVGEGPLSAEASALSVAGPGPLPTADDSYEASFEDGEDDWVGTGFWHRASEGESNHPNSFTAPGAFWFGREDTGTYDGGALATAGALVSPPISLTGTPSPVLSFASWYETEDTGAVWDTKKVYVSTNNGSSWILLGQVFGPADYRRWATRLADLGPYSGLVVRLKFEFGTADALNNDFRGWYLDNIRVFRDDDRDGLSLAEELRAGSNPQNPDTDGDGIGDLHDQRPTVEDVPPTWLYVGTDHPIGQVTFYPENGFIDVSIEAPQDNVGVEGVDFSVELHGTAGGQPQNSTARVSLNLSDDGLYRGRFPIPRNFNLGQVTSEKFAVIPKDVNGNKLSVEFAASVTLQFDIPWEDKTSAGWAKLELADVAQSTQGQASLVARKYALVLPKAPPPVAVLEVPAVRLPGVADAAETVAPLQASLVFQAEELVPREDVLKFNGGLFNQIWAGVKTGWSQWVEPEVQSFIFGSDVNGHIAGDIIAGMLIYGDVRDIVLGALEGDEIQFSMGVIGLATTFTGPGDGAFGALKAVVKIVPVSLGRPIAKEAAHAITNPATLVEDLGKLANLAKHVGPDAAKAARFNRYYEAFPGAHPLLKLATEADLRSIDLALAKYDALGVDVLAKFKGEGSRLNNPEAFLKAARAEERFKGTS